MTFDKFGGRKAVMTGIVLTIGLTVDLLTERGLSENLLYLLIAAAGGFMVGNVGEHAASAQKAKAQDGTKLLELQKEMDSLAKIVETSHNEVNRVAQVNEQVINYVDNYSKETNARLTKIGG